MKRFKYHSLYIRLDSPELLLISVSLGEVFQVVTYIFVGDIMVALWVAVVVERVGLVA